MDGLKALLAKKRKAAQEEFGGRSCAKRVEIEQTRLDQLRNEERIEIAAKVRQVVEQILFAVCTHCSSDSQMIAGS